MKQFAVTGEDSLPNSPIQKIINGALGIPIALSTAPTTAGGELPNHGDNGTDGVSWYINLFGTVFKINLTAV